MPPWRSRSLRGGCCSTATRTRCTFTTSTPSPILAVNQTLCEALRLRPGGSCRWFADAAAHRGGARQAARGGDRAPGNARPQFPPSLAAAEEIGEAVPVEIFSRPLRQGEANARLVVAIDISATNCTRKRNWPTSNASAIRCWKPCRCRCSTAIAPTLSGRQSGLHRTRPEPNTSSAARPGTSRRSS